MAELAGFARLELPIRELMIGPDDRLIAVARDSTEQLSCVCDRVQLAILHGAHLRS
jgi:hypothetical protein